MHINFHICVNVFVINPSMLVQCYLFKNLNIQETLENLWYLFILIFNNLCIKILL